MRRAAPVSPPSTRKRKWKSDNVVRINFADDDSDQDVTTAVVQQASRDGRRFGKTFHPVSVPRETLTLPIHHIPVPAEDVDFAMETLDEDGEEGSPNTSTPTQVSPAHLCYLPLVLTVTTG